MLCCLPLGIVSSIYSLMHFDVVAPARFNALGLVAGHGLRPLVGRRVRSWQHLRWSAPVAVAFTLAWFVVRNLGFGPFPALYV